MTEPGAHSNDFEPIEESPAGILGTAKPFPPFEEMVVDGLAEDEDRIFLKTILNA